ncbi:hypothetical protein GF386_05060 [Candidatus Pacearchaeota archaeon]|nr:hypothetical protein [Candidatus Pacearchaeota archaeon]MBD3283480.1 hypothetical protein [Candidatus Pacearchaeota archaeon]
MTEIENLIKKVNPKIKKGKNYQIVYDSSSETLEPIYFWLLDFMNQNFKGRVEKIIDNFSSSPGSGHFSELGQKMSQMQQEASRVLGTVNNILKGILNLIYDLKEYKIRLSHYEAAESKNKSTAEAGLNALKQVWMDKVDIQRGQGSINALASGNLQFVTLRDAFMAVQKPEDVDKLDLNERVRRLLKPRIQEFLEWKKRSEHELKKRFEVEKYYLKSQVEALKLNTRWARPYLQAAHRLMADEKIASDPALVTTFNTIVMELTLIGKNPIDIEEEVADQTLPPGFERMKLKTYNSIVILDFKFRGIPSKAGQHYVFGGRVEVDFKSYAMNEEEIEELKYQLSQSDLELSFKLIEGMTTDSLQQIQVDLNELLGEESKKSEKKSDDVSPFGALFKPIKPKKKERSEEEKHEERVKKIKSEKYAERKLRELAIKNANSLCFRVYDIYKKGHGLASFPY